MSGKPYRLSASAHDSGYGRAIDREKVVDFHWNGQRMPAFKGDSLASALMANGVRVMGRSFKYHRPRSVLGLGAEEPNALVGVGEGNKAEPNLRASQVEVFDGMTAKPQNAWPSTEFDIGAINNTFSRFIPSGFYYKTFMWPQKFWKSVYEPFIRNAAGLGVAPTGPDPDTYEQFNCHCDVLIVGGGVAGIAAAEAAAATGGRVILVDENPNLGGVADLFAGEIDGKPQTDWVAEKVERLAGLENVQILTRTTGVGHFHQNYLMLFQRLSEHDPALANEGVPRHRLWKVRAKQVIVATGALERPIPFANCDRPGVMLSSAIRGYAVRYGVAVGQRGVLFTNNDDAYQTATILAKAGVPVAAIVDARTDPSGPLIEEAKAASIKIITGSAISGLKTTFGGKLIKVVEVASYTGGSRVAGTTQE
ncbi:MAG: 2Fe-2S iron-sulfur cluster-binding protein, partial [Hyphomicrobiales bacterium]